VRAARNFDVLYFRAEFAGGFTMARDWVTRMVVSLSPWTTICRMKLILSMRAGSALGESAKDEESAQGSGDRIPLVCAIHDAQFGNVVACTDFFF
jgi:hypothetical protein